MQGRSDDQREILDAVFGFLAAHRRELFPDEMFGDLFPSGRAARACPPM
jgi:hypothetical protein